MASLYYVGLRARKTIPICWRPSRHEVTAVSATRSATLSSSFRWPCSQTRQWNTPKRPFPAATGQCPLWSGGPRILHWQPAVIRLGGAVAKASRRLRRTEESVSRRRQLLQQSYYQAAIQLLPAAPVLGCAGRGPAHEALHQTPVDPAAQPDPATGMLRDEFFISPERRRLCIDASLATVEAISPPGAGGLVCCM